VSISLSKFSKYRPFLFHATRSDNIPGLRRLREIFCVSKLKGDQGGDNGIRGDSEVLLFQNFLVKLGDQHPLQVGHIHWQGGWNLTTLLESLDNRVFFFPGKDEQLPEACENFVRRKSSRGIQMKILRMPTSAVMDASDASRFEFCKYNSGAPRTTLGNKSPRGPDTFVHATKAPFRISEVYEVTVFGSVKIPKTTMILDTEGWMSF